MRSRVLVDTGPLVALLTGGDRYHGWAVAQLREVEPPLLTCESVLSEACFLVRELDGGAEAVMRRMVSGAVTGPFRLQSERTPVGRLMKKYSDLSMSLADACLVRMSEQVADSVVLTLDRHFRIYRRHGRQIIPTILPAA